MRPRAAHAFVLRTSGLGEADVLVTLYTLEEGLLRGVARSARRSRRRFGGALEPLTRVRASYRERLGSELVGIEDLEILRSYFAAQREPAVAAACAYVAEVVEQFGRAGESDARMFRLVGAVLDELARGVDPRVPARYFEIWTLRLHGLLPALRSCAACDRALTAGCLDLGKGELCCTRCVPPAPGAVRVGPSALALAEAILKQPPGGVAAAPRAVAELGRLAAALLSRFAERAFRSARALEDLTR